MRYLAHTAEDRRQMLAAVGAPDIEALFADVPPAARLTAPIPGLPTTQSEMAVETAMAAFASDNLAPSRAPCFLGAGTYSHHVPASVDHLIQRGEFLTAYTPYQPEVSQGTLQALFEFQTQVALLTGMEVANASMYDGATACAEAVLMAMRLTRRPGAILLGGVHPHYAETTETLLRFSDHTIDVRPAAPGAPLETDFEIGSDIACVVAQTPDLFGRPHDLSQLAARCHEAGALLVVVVTEIVSLGLLPPPGEMGADIVAAEGQSIGVAASFGGPHLGLLATRSKYVRQMPGRVCGETADDAGRRCFVLTLSTREQHIRREKATSNICTNSGLCTLAFTVHLSLLGETGFRNLARLNHARARRLAGLLRSVPGVELLTDAYFNEFTLRLERDAAAIVEALARRGILAGVPLSRLLPGRADLAGDLVLAATETASHDDQDRLAAALTEVLEEAP